ncbi:iron chelate uptake ABC transporter family permease subunit [Streptomyces sp. UNOC14_S4]|uniref:FecCD family ABC transporter permease n=1 Tax=Streptomyces sp. UNOC14_S4 TaxID=2872340 RepID=UPI001E35926B|nr:iron chelate uptake ABC transporter family permease subunit [Streptomyces sp. UNOC14_S4]MCC3769469.1 iron chelate uptake ABC transporter family permease subunit [Streptomyces sp. UNOC14_S4]
MSAPSSPRTASRVIRTRGGLSLRVAPRAVLVVAALLAVAAAAAVALIGTGDYPMSPADVLTTLTGGGTPAQEFIVQDLRLPRVLVGLLVGAALGTAGAVFQSVSRNPLGSPDVIGFGQGSAVGALAVIVLFHGSPSAVAAGAVAGGLVTGAAVYLLAWKKGVHGYRLVLVGIGAAAVLTGVRDYLMTRADLNDATRAMVWMVGSLNGRDWGQVWPLLVVCALLLPVLLGQGRALRMMEMGEDAACALGIRTERVRVVVMGAAVLLTGVATAAAGPIGFIALAAPQLAKRLTRAPGPNLAASACMGAALLITADWASQRFFGAGQLPVGAVTGMVGGCYLLWLLFTERKAGRI